MLELRQSLAFYYILSKIMSNSETYLQRQALLGIFYIRTFMEKGVLFSE